MLSVRDRSWMHFMCSYPFNCLHFAAKWNCILPFFGIPVNYMGFASPIGMRLQWAYSCYSRPRLQGLQGKHASPPKLLYLPFNFSTIRTCLSRHHPHRINHHDVYKIVFWSINAYPIWSSSTITVLPYGHTCVRSISVWLFRKLHCTLMHAHIIWVRAIPSIWMQYPGAMSRA